MLHSESECLGKGCPEHSYPPEKKLTWEETVQSDLTVPREKLLEQARATWQARQPEIDRLKAEIKAKALNRMTKEEQIKAAQESIACALCTGLDACPWEHPDFSDLGCSAKLRLAERILALPNIAVLDENQELPENPHRDYNAELLGQSPACYAYQEAQKDMLKEGWKKVLK